MSVAKLDIARYAELQHRQHLSGWFFECNFWQGRRASVLGTIDVYGYSADELIFFGFGRATPRL